MRLLRFAEGLEHCITKSICLTANNGFAVSPCGLWCNNLKLKISNGGKIMTKKKVLAQSFLLFAGILMVGFGVWREEAETVLSKAIRLCMECVGIG